jgi:hypothetical protein
MDVGDFVRHLCVLVLRHQMRASNYFVNSFYSVLGVRGGGLLLLAACTDSPLLLVQLARLRMSQPAQCAVN